MEAAPVFADDVERALRHLELQPHVPEVQSVRHAPEDGDGDGEPAVEEEAHTGAVYGEDVEEERVDEETGGADQKKNPVPFLDPFGSGIQNSAQTFRF